METEDFEKTWKPVLEKLIRQEPNTIHYDCPQKRVWAVRTCCWKRLDECKCSQNP